MQTKVTVRSSVLEVLLEITKFCDLYLMERILDDTSEVCINFPVANVMCQDPSCSFFCVELVFFKHFTSLHTCV